MTVGEIKLQFRYGVPLLEVPIRLWHSSYSMSAACNLARTRGCSLARTQRQSSCCSSTLGPPWPTVAVTPAGRAGLCRGVCVHCCSQPAVIWPGVVDHPPRNEWQACRLVQVAYCAEHWCLYLVCNFMLGAVSCQFMLGIIPMCPHLVCMQSHSQTPVLLCLMNW